MDVSTRRHRARDGCQEEAHFREDHSLTSIPREAESSESTCQSNPFVGRAKDGRFVDYYCLGGAVDVESLRKASSVEDCTELQFNPGALTQNWPHSPMYNHPPTPLTPLKNPLLLFCPTQNIKISASRTSTQIEPSSTTKHHASLSCPLSRCCCLRRDYILPCERRPSECGKQHGLGLAKCRLGYG